MMSAPTATTASKRPNKPLVEKKRRERINSSLDQMKNLVLESLQKDSAEYSKMEKADILEMTVGFLRDFQRSERLRHQMSATGPVVDSMADNYRAGYRECLTEVSRYLQASTLVNTTTKLHILDHLASNVSPVGLQQQGRSTGVSTPPSPAQLQMMSSHNTSAVRAAPVVQPSGIASITPVRHIPVVAVPTGATVSALTCVPAYTPPTPASEPPQEPSSAVMMGMPSSSRTPSPSHSTISTPSSYDHPSTPTSSEFSRPATPSSPTSDSYGSAFRYNTVSPPVVDLSQTRVNYCHQMALVNKMVSAPVRHQKVWRPW